MTQQVSVVETRNDPDLAVVAVSGPLTSHTLPEINGGLGKALIERRCIVVDVSGLWLMWDPGITVFSTVLTYAGGWPTVRMALFAASDEVAAALRWSRVTETVPLAVDLEAAQRRVQRRPDLVRRYQDLPPELSTSRAAQAMVTEACADWRIPRATANAAIMVVTELVVNAVTHANTAIRVVVELTDKALAVSVQDLRPDRPARLGPSGPDDPPGSGGTATLGLQMVSALAHSWGVMERPDAKIVWARLLLAKPSTAR